MIVVPRPEYNLREKVYFWEIAKGLWVTLGHLLRNMLGALMRQRTIQTWEYPEEPRRYDDRVRLIHRLVKRPDGTPKCVACYMCATACPALAIEIIAEPSPDDSIEKRPLSFVIDELRCVMCGFCVEACPKDAIRMDSEVGDLAGTRREDFVYTLEQLLEMRPRPGAYLGDRELEAKRKAGMI
ncbi:MAG: NADH-quinone oxidoreductase subunit I [Myxococcales bacterium]|nr:NADH-quinone oxidoreductase subunit I [Myxococcales bacterium]